MAEGARRTPVAGSYDVAVVGAGLSWLIAAIAAGRAGARTVLLDRFGMVGGNLGPAMIVGGSVAGEAQVTLPGGIAGIPRELVEAMGRLKLPAAHRYADETNIIPYLGTKWAREAGVDLLLPVWAADPIVEDGAVSGLFVEGKGGRVALRATVVIDASADADVCRRAGVPVVTDQAPDPNWPVIGKNRLDPAYVPWNDTAIYFVAGGVDFARFRAFAEGQTTLSEEDERWLEEMGRFPISTQKFEPPMVPLLRRAWQDGSFRLYKNVDEHVHLTTPNIWKGPFDGGLAGQPHQPGRRDPPRRHVAARPPGDGDPPARVRDRAVLPRARARLRAGVPADHRTLLRIARRSAHRRRAHDHPVRRVRGPPLRRRRVRQHPLRPAPVGVRRPRDSTRRTGR